MRNNIASFAKINSTLSFAQIVTKIMKDFSKEAILFLIYLLADKAKYQTCNFKCIIFKVVTP